MPNVQKRYKADIDLLHQDILNKLNVMVQHLPEQINSRDNNEAGDVKNLDKLLTIQNNAVFFAY